MFEYFPRGRKHSLHDNVINILRPGLPAKISFSDLASSIKKRVAALKQEQEQLKADYAMLETRLKRAAGIEAKISALKLSPAYLGVDQIDKLMKDSQRQIGTSEAILKAIDALQGDPKYLKEEQIDILQYQVKLKELFKGLKNSMGSHERFDTLVTKAKDT